MRIHTNIILAFLVSKIGLITLLAQPGSGSHEIKILKKTCFLTVGHFFKMYIFDVATYFLS